MFWLLSLSRKESIFYVQILWRHTDNLSVAKSLKLPDLILSLLLLLKTNSLIMWCFVTLWRATLKLFRRHCNHKPKLFDVGIEYKSIDKTFIFGLLEETNIESSIAFLKSLCIFYTQIAIMDTPKKISKGQRDSLFLTAFIHRISVFMIKFIIQMCHHTFTKNTFH